jgi:hypothetical protein
MAAVDMVSTGNDGDKNRSLIARYGQLGISWPAAYLERLASRATREPKRL